MSKVYISEQVSPALIEYLLDCGHEPALIGSGQPTKFDSHPQVHRLQPAENVDKAISCHPDIVYCGLGHGRVFHGNPDLPGLKYPADVLYNACSTGKYFIHNLKYTAPELLAAADELGLIKVHVPQGYTRCSVLPVDENSIITYDQGIAAACALRAPALNVLTVRPGHVELPGYASGFIGGTGGRVSGTILFNGDLTAHPDFNAIREFIESRGLECRWFDDVPLTDIGSIIEEK